MLSIRRYYQSYDIARVLQHAKYETDNEII